MKNIRIVVLLDNNYSSDNRVRREVRALSELGHEITVYTLTSQTPFAPVRTEDNAVIKHILFDANKFLNVKGFFYRRRFINRLSEEIRCDVLHCHDFIMLWVGVLLKKRLQGRTNTPTKLIFDDHDFVFGIQYYEETSINKWIYFKSRIVWLWHRFIEKKNVKHANCVITVSQSLSTLLNYVHALNKPPTIIRNTPERFLPFTLSGVSLPIREEFNIPPEKKIIVFTGDIDFRRRGIDKVLKEMAETESAVLVLIGKVKDYKIHEIIQRYELRDKVYIKHPVEISQLLQICSTADIGLVSIGPLEWTSLRYSLPNKFFEALQAGLPVLSATLPEIISLLDIHQCGVSYIPGKEGSFRENLDLILENYSFYKKNVEATREKLCWENEKLHLIKLYTNLCAGLREY